MVFQTLTHEDVLSVLPNRKNNTHKGDYGRILLLCGSTKYTGAPALAAMGALRSGAGLVLLGVPASIHGIEASKLLEPIIVPLPDKNGLLSAQAIPLIASLFPRTDALLIGPGLGQSEDVCEVVRWVLKEYPGPVVLDADGINALKSHKDILRDRTAVTILTPHEGEFLRLYGKEITTREESAVELAQEYGVIVVLKGHNTVITDANMCYINPTGNPGMAVGGSGDVLSGIIVSLLGQGIEPLQAAACGVWLHGASGDLCAKEIGQYGMLPSDMLKVLPRLMK